MSSKIILKKFVNSCFMKFFNQTLIIFVIVISFIGCDEHACPNEYEMGAFQLLESTKNLFPYKDSVVQIVFRDSMQNEVIAIANRIGDVLEGYTSSQRECLYNSAEQVLIRAQTQSISAIISISELDLKFSVSFRTSPNFNLYKDDYVADLGSVGFNRPLVPLMPGMVFHFPPQIGILINQRNDPDTHSSSFPMATDVLLDEVFENVYTNSIGRDSMEIYYNHEIGLIGFKKKPDGALYVFERFE